MTNKLNTSTAHAVHYGELLKNWPKGIGPKPTNEMFAVAHASGIRPGKKHGLAVAMYQRQNGATEFETRVAAAAMAHIPLYEQTALFNYVRRRIEGGLFARDMTVGYRANTENGKNEPVWRVTLTDQGRAEIERRLPGATGNAEAKAVPIIAKAKAAKAAAKAAKPKAAKKAKPVEAAPVEAAPVIEPVAVEPVEAAAVEPQA